MAKYVPDSKTQRWVIIASTRIKRPHSTNSRPTTDPFAEGNEASTPDEVFRIGTGEKNKPGWLVRVIPNKFPITDIHEVVIHSPSKYDDIDTLPRAHVVHILESYRARYLELAPKGHVLIFCNHGMQAGASLEHPHSQIVVLPKQINLDSLSREPVKNMVEENESFVSYCPDFSQWPFETWISPKNDLGNFGATTDSELHLLGSILQRAVQAIGAIYEDADLPFYHAGVPFAYNYYIAHGNEWFIRIVPRFVQRAGFELGTGLHVNMVDPEDAAVMLKETLKGIE